MIKGALRANCPDKLTVLLPQSLHKQPYESQELLSQVSSNLMWEEWRLPTPIMGGGGAGGPQPPRPADPSSKAPRPRRMRFSACMPCRTFTRTHAHAGGPGVHTPASPRRTTTPIEALTLLRAVQVANLIEMPENDDKPLMEASRCARRTWLWLGTRHAHDD